LPRNASAVTVPDAVRTAGYPAALLRQRNTTQFMSEESVKICPLNGT
jgi:hypothetical protein